MRRIVVATMTLLAGLAVVAAPAVAQDEQEVRERPAVSGRGMMAGGPGAMGRNPAAALLERQEALELTAEQVRQIEAIRVRVEQENAPRLEQLRAVFGQRAGRDVPVEERRQLRERMQELRPVREALRATNRAAGEEIRGILTDAQREQLRELRRTQRQEMRERMRSERRGDGAWEGRRRRPRPGPGGGGL